VITGDGCRNDRSKALFERLSRACAALARAIDAGAAMWMEMDRRCRLRDLMVSAMAVDTIAERCREAGRGNWRKENV